MTVSAFVLTGLSLVASASSAKTWVIHDDGSGDAPTVQAGIDSAAVGDTVLVHPGTYKEVIDFLGKDIVVKSATGPESTVIDASDLSSEFVVYLQSDESRQAILEGFTVTGGSGGVFLKNSEPSILGNIITGNGGIFSGAGIWSGGQPFDRVPTFRPLIKGNRITNNTATRIAGGIGTWQRMAPEIIENYIAGNEATEGDGGGIYLRLMPDDTGSIIRGNVIENNYAGDHGGGFHGATALASGTVTYELSWNVVAGNRADGVEENGHSGGGIRVSMTNAWIHHNTFVNNVGNGPDSIYGGGVALYISGSPLIEKNIIAHSQNGAGIWCDSGTTPNIRSNLAWQNQPAHGVGDCPDWWQGDGNIVDDPAFCDPDNGDYSVAQNSPAMTHPAGPLGALHLPGCGPVAVMPTTWGRIKSMYGSN